MSRLAEIRETPIESAEVEQAVAHGGAGAIVNFIGRVRDHNDGKPVTVLEYEAYATMATREMRKIVDELEQRFVGVRLAVLHRVGALQIGDPAVVCAASAPHRAEAFAACRTLIDEIKSRVPIWKREHGPNGPYWVGWQDARCVGHHAVDSSPAAHGNSHQHHSLHHLDSHGDHHAGKACEAKHLPSATLNGWRICCVTVSDTRDAKTDSSGALADQLLSAAGAAVERCWLRDEAGEIAQLVRELVSRSPDAVVLTGGTGIGPRDVTCEAVLPLLTRQLDGFGEAFRRLSFDMIGTRALLSRAIAGTIGATLVFAVPGSPNAVRLALESLIIPLLPHARSMLNGCGH